MTFIFNRICDEICKHMLNHVYEPQTLMMLLVDHYGGFWFGPEADAPELRHHRCYQHGICLPIDWEHGYSISEQAAVVCEHAEALWLSCIDVVLN